MLRKLVFSNMRRWEGKRELLASGTKAEEMAYVVRKLVIYVRIEQTCKYGEHNGNQISHSWQSKVKCGTWEG